MKPATLTDLDRAALRQDLPAYGLIAGHLGTVVQGYGHGEAFEVEFVATDGRTLAIETSTADQIGVVPSRHVLHARKLATT